ncbi:MAG: hypothetical protein KAT30_09310, partial [Candidatus Krumholzibacteria bacterium]|nr:hypothetical protein [Candidatus Krumholzibacteria bacterium]
SVLFARTKDYRVRLNVYPGLFRIGPLTPGFFLADRRDNGLVFGITYIYQPGLPIGVATDVH